MNKSKMDERPDFPVSKLEDWIIINTLAPIILNHVRGCIVEIGAGFSTKMFAKIAADAGVNFYSCDTNADKLTTIKKEVEREVSVENSKIAFFGLPSISFMKRFESDINERPAIVFLDGCHAYHIVRVEANYFLQKMLVGGVMFLHDTLSPKESYITAPFGLGEVYKVRQDLEKTENTDCFTWPYTAKGYGLTMVIKKELDRPYYRE